MCDGVERGSGARECERGIAQAAALEMPKLEMEKKSPKDKDGTPRPLSQYVHDLGPNLQYKGILRASYKEINPSYIEIVFRDRAVAIPKNNLHNNALKAQKDGVQISINIPDDVAFALLHRYLTRGDYSRNFDHTIGYDIDPIDMFDLGGSNRNDMLADMRMWRVAAHIQNPELEDLVRQHLKKSWHTTRNPVPALDYAYHGPDVESDDDKKAMEKWEDPSSGLREWVREFLVKRVDEMDSSRDTFDRLLPGRRVRPMHVLDWLEESELQNQWKKCKEKGGCLVSDVDWARTQIKTRRVDAWNHDRMGNVKVLNYPIARDRPGELEYSPLRAPHSTDYLDRDLEQRLIERKLAERKLEEERALDRIKARAAQELKRRKNLTDTERLMRELERVRLTRGRYETRIPGYNVR